VPLNIFSRYSYFTEEIKLDAVEGNKTSSEMNGKETGVRI
jgi:hypothetical protein